MKTISFNLNWNGKLYCNVFTTIRPKNPEKYIVNEVYEIRLKGKNCGQAKLLYEKDFVLGKITEAMSLTDIGYPAKYAPEVFADLYPDIKNIALQTFTYLVFERIQKDHKHNNQLNENRTVQAATIPVPERFCNLCVPVDGINSTGH